jgi:putative Mn2+ efflux pump MntP
MHFLTIIFIAVGLSMDSFAVSVASGCVLREVRLRNAVKVGLFFGGFQALMPLLGWAGASRFSGLISDYDHWAAFFLLLLIGSKMIYEGFQMKEPENRGDPLRLRILLLMAVATSIDALAVGAGFAFLNEPILIPAAVIGVTTFIFSAAGVLIGCRTGSRLQNRAEFAGGIILILIGAKILAEHTLV